MRFFRRFLVAFLLLIPVAVHADVEGRAYYVTVNQVGAYVLEEWLLYVPAQSDLLYQINKNNIQGEKSTTSEIELAAKFSTVEQGNGYYLKYHFAEHPYQLEHGQKSFGRIEVRDGPFSVVTEQWPLFYEAENLSRRLRKLSMRAYKPNGELFVVVKYYTTDNYYFPERIVYQNLQYDFEKGQLFFLSSATSRKVNGSVVEISDNK